MLPYQVPKVNQLACAWSPSQESDAVTAPATTVPYLATSVIGGLQNFTINVVPTYRHSDVTELEYFVIAPDLDFPDL